MRVSQAWPASMKIISPRLLLFAFLFAVALPSAAQIESQRVRGVGAEVVRDSTRALATPQTQPVVRRQPPSRFDGIAYQDTVAMLVVLVRFQDDNWGDCGYWWCHLERWPHTDFFGSGDDIPRTQLPDWASTLLVRDPERINEDDLTLQDSSLSAYYFWQSAAGPSGPHIVYGDVWPEVYVTERANRAYYNRRDSLGTTVRRRSGFGYLTKELLDNLVNRGLDPGKYDHDRDGVVDHIMMIFRRDSLYMGKGWATLSGYYDAGGTPDVDGNRRPDELRYWSEGRQDSVLVDWAHSGSQNFAADVDLRLFVHEYGHRIMNLGGHLPTLRYEEPVPGQPAICAYARMCGVPTTYDIATITLSAHERRRMGWLNPRVIRPSEGDVEGVELRDLYASGEAVLIPLGDNAVADTMMIANRQRLSFFDHQRAVPSLHPDYDYVYKGMATHGLHISLSDGDPSDQAGAYRYGFLPADGTYTARSRCTGAFPDCIGLHSYDGDLFGPEWVDQLTPWTRPNSSGLRRADLVPPEGLRHWFAIDRIRYKPDEPDSTMLFDFVADIRHRPQYLAVGSPWPVIRVDSWMGVESDEIVFADEVLVERGATLYIGADNVLSESPAGRHASLGAVRIAFERGLRMEAGARLVVGPEAEISVERGVLGGAGAEIVAEPGASIILARRVAFEGSSLLGEPSRALRNRFRRR